jgi:hypothetical protein
MDDVYDVAERIICQRRPCGLTLADDSSENEKLYHPGFCFRLGLMEMTL